MEVVKTAEVILLERTKYKIKTLTLTFKMFNSCILVQQIHQPTPQNWAKTVILTGNFVKNVKIDFEILFQLSEKATIRCSLFFKFENVYLCEK